MARGYKRSEAPRFAVTAIVVVVAAIGCYFLGRSPNEVDPIKARFQAQLATMGTCKEPHDPAITSHIDELKGQFAFVGRALEINRVKASNGQGPSTLKRPPHGVKYSREMTHREWMIYQILARWLTEHHDAYAVSNVRTNSISHCEDGDAALVTGVVSLSDRVGPAEEYEWERRFLFRRGANGTVLITRNDAIGKETEDPVDEDIKRFEKTHPLR